MMANKKLRTLYICYFGVREPLVQTQVLTYLRQLSSNGIDVSLLTFEPDFLSSWGRDEKQDCHDRLAADGIRWFILPYHKRPSAPATVYDILAGARFVTKLIRKHSIDVLHARSHIPLAIVLLARAWTGCPLIFDIRGLMAEEYVDAGIWQEDSLVFRAIKRLERTGIAKAEQIVVLTNRMRQWLVEQRLAGTEKIEVIPCCVDFSIFERANTEPENPLRRFELIYAGSVEGLYLLEEMGHFFLALRARQPDAFFRILTRATPEYVAKVFQKLGIDANDYAVESAAPVTVPFRLRKADIGISFRKPTFSQIAASPTKIPEYLAAGIPVVCNTGIGDMDRLIEDENVGVLVSELNAEQFAESVEKILILAKNDKVSQKCIQVARRGFDLNLVGGAGYLRVYRKIEKSLALEATYTVIS
jgi:glycosyltransferase involved in cell wall biosynthesis